MASLEYDVVAVAKLDQKSTEIEMEHEFRVFFKSFCNPRVFS